LTLTSPPRFGHPFRTRDRFLSVRPPMFFFVSNPYPGGGVRFPPSISTACLISSPRNNRPQSPYVVFSYQAPRTPPLQPLTGTFPFIFFQAPTNLAVFIPPSLLGYGLSAPGWRLLTLALPPLQLSFPARLDGRCHMAPSFLLSPTSVTSLSHHPLRSQGPRFRLQTLGLGGSLPSRFSLPVLVQHRASRQTTCFFFPVFADQRNLELHPRSLPFFLLCSCAAILMTYANFSFSPSMDSSNQPPNTPPAQPFRLTLISLLPSPPCQKSPPQKEFTHCKLGSGLSEFVSPPPLLGPSFSQTPFCCCPAVTVVFSPIFWMSCPTSSHCRPPRISSFFSQQFREKKFARWYPRASFSSTTFWADPLICWPSPLSRVRSSFFHREERPVVNLPHLLSWFSLLDFFSRGPQKTFSPFQKVRSTRLKVAGSFLPCLFFPDVSDLRLVRSSPCASGSFLKSASRFSFFSPCRFSRGLRLVPS